LRVAARHGSAYWTRWAAALAAMAAGGWIYLVTLRDAPKETGIILFVTLTILANLYALLAGLRATADSLSEEKREGTLGLLFLTDLKGYDIVLGKLAATSLGAFYGMLAMFPVMGMSLLLGGVSPGEFGRVILVSINNLLFSLAAGMFCSSISREDRKAMGATFLIVVLLAALPLLGMLASLSLNSRTLSPLFQIPSPGFTVFAAFDVNYRGTRYQDAYWLSLALVHGLAWLFLIAASLIVPRCWQDQASRAGLAGLGERLRQRRYGLASVRLDLRRRLLGVNPMLWLASRDRYKPAAVFVALAALGCGWLWIYLEAGRYFLVGGAIPTAMAAHSILKVWFANESCRRFSEDRRSGALELLLATPLSVREILRGQRLALWRQFAWPTVAVLAADALLLTASAARMNRLDSSFVQVWLAGMTVLVWDLHALSWVGPWMGLNSRSPNRAATAALARICLLPWMLFAGWIAALAVCETVLRIHLPGRFQEGVFIGVWFALCALTNIGFTAWAGSRLRTRFRETATQRFDAGRGAGGWGRTLGLWVGRKTG